MGWELRGWIDCLIECLILAMCIFHVHLSFLITHVFVVVVIVVGFVFFWVGCFSSKLWCYFLSYYYSKKGHKDVWLKNSTKKLKISIKVMPSYMPFFHLHFAHLILTLHLSFNSSKVTYLLKSHIHLFNATYLPTYHLRDLPNILTYQPT